MKVLILPINIASQPAITAEALNKLPGITAKCITQVIHPIQTLGENTIFIPKHYPRRKPFKWLYYKLSYKWRIEKWIKWADVLHYVWEPALPDGKDLEIAYKMKKPIFIEWLGGDIREHKYLEQINKFYKEIFNNGYEYFELETSGHSQKVQQEFGKVKAKALLCPEMKLFLDKKLFPEGAITFFQRMNIQDFEPQYPSPSKKKPLIIHSPSAKVCKGTSHILAALETLSKKYDFDFKLVQNLTRVKALELLQECDIFIDQIILGSYGSASMEAMSFGKPVVCYIMPEVYEAGLPSDCPIISANPENITEKLEGLIKDATYRNEVGIKSRAFVEKYHDADKLAYKLVDLYKKELELKKTGSKEYR